MKRGSKILLIIIALLVLAVVVYVVARNAPDATGSAITGQVVAEENVEVVRPTYPLPVDEEPSVSISIIDESP